MAIFQRWALTDKAQALITKAQAKGYTISFTRAATGNGIWSEDESIEYASDIKSMKQEFAFSQIDIPDGNPSTVVLEVIINNLNLTELYYLTEMGIYAKDPDAGEVLYAIAAASGNAVYVPANNGIGISTITERVNVEVANSANVTIETTGAVVSVTDFLALKNTAEILNIAMKGGMKGQNLIKSSEKDYDVQWDTFIPVITAPYADFPETGEVNTVYIDTDSSEIYVWQTNESGGEYFKLPLGAEASQTLQKQITANKNAIDAANVKITKLETAQFSEKQITVPASGWISTTESGVKVYTNEIEVTGMTEDTTVTVWPYLINTDAAKIVEEQKAQTIFFGKGKSYKDTDKIILKCYGKAPSADFGILLQGVS